MNILKSFFILISLLFILTSTPVFAVSMEPTSGVLKDSSNARMPPIIPIQAEEVRKIEGVYKGIAYSMEGLNLRPDSVKNVKEDPHLKSLKIEISSPRGGMLDVKLPTRVLDLLPGNGDNAKFFVLIDGEDTDFTKSRMSEAGPLNLRVSFPKEATVIEIFGIEIPPIALPGPPPGPPPPPPAVDQVLIISAIAAVIIGISLAVAFIVEKRKREVAA